MQLVRNAFVPRLAQERSLRRKLIEIYLAGRLERSLSKQQILALYLNVIYLGNGTYGVEAASRDLFGKSVDRLTVAEGATLAALARGPSLYAPRRHPDRALARRNLVLTVMAREHYLSDSLAARARRAPLRLSPAEWRPRQDASSRSMPCGRWWTRSCGDAPLRRPHRLHLARRPRPSAPPKRGAPAGRRRSTAPQARRGRAATPCRARSWRSIRGTGELRARRRRPPLRAARVQSRARWRGGSQVRPSSRSCTPPRSSDGLTPAAVVMDTPVEIAGKGGMWRPANFDGRYAGPLTLRRALMRSANAATVRLGEAVGERRVVSLRAPRRHPQPAGRGACPRPGRRRGDAARAGRGLRAVRQRRPAGRAVAGPADRRRRRHGALARSAAEIGARARRGGGVSAHLDARVGGGRRHRPGDPRPRRAGRRSRARPAPPTTAPTSGSSATRRRVVAASGSATNAPRPITPSASGGRLAAPAWARSTSNGWREREPDAWPAPAGMVSRTIDAFNGDLANQWCPVTQREWFRAGTEPTRICHEHSAPLVDRLEEFGRKVGRALKDLLGL